jgi:Xaa-Pro aminopeptidase
MTLAENPPPLFKSRHRKIAPFARPDHPGAAAGAEALEAYARDKAGYYSQYRLGFGELAEREWAAAGLAGPDMDAMRSYRIERVRQQLHQRDLAGILLYDPLNLRYATDATNMQLWCTHNAVRYAFIATDGPVTLWDFHHCEHLSGHSGVVDDVRHGIPWFYFEAGPRFDEFAARWAAELASVIRASGGGSNPRIAADRINPEGLHHLNRHGVSIVNGEEVMELARSIKSADEIKAMRRSIEACEAAMRVMEADMTPGMSENDLWAILHAENVRRGGEWIETRLLSSGPRTNPWFQESSARIIEAGDIVAFDTDLIGPYGYCCDISRTWLAGSGKATNEQIDLYSLAVDQIETNMAMLGPGLSFRDLSEKGRTLPDDCLPNRYSVLFHGVGLCDEYPTVPYPDDWAHSGYDGELQPGMVVCVESYVGRHGGHEGVKLEDQVLITEDGHQQLSTYPLDERLLGRVG